MGELSQRQATATPAAANCSSIGTSRRNVGVISAGRVGSVFGAALARAGFTVTAASATSDASVQRARLWLPDVPILPPARVARESDVVLVAVPDDAIGPLVGGLARAGAFRQGQVVVHTSGAHGVSVLHPIVAAGAIPLALHPVMTFTGQSEDLPRLTSSSVCVTAIDNDDIAWATGASLAREVGAVPVRVPENARPLYHAALAHGANHMCALVNDCVQLLSSAGISDAAGLLRPLLSAALSNSLFAGDAALTGPVSRGDAGTVRAHLRVLDEHAPDVASSYIALAKRAATRAHLAGRLDATSAEQLAKVLEPTDTERVGVQMSSNSR